MIACGTSLIDTAIGSDIAVHPLASVTCTRQSPDRYDAFVSSIDVFGVPVVKPAPIKVVDDPPSGPIHSNIVPLVLVLNSIGSPAQFGPFTEIVGVSAGGKIELMSTSVTTEHPSVFVTVNVYMPFDASLTAVTTGFL